MIAAILNMKGPEFLVLYAGLSACVYFIVRNRLHARDLKEIAGRIDLKEPLTIAYLRGGAAEVLRVAAFSLVDRGLLLFDGRTLCAKSTIASSLVRRPIERAMLERLAAATPPSEMMQDARLRAAGAEYAAQLRERGLIASAATYAARQPIFRIGAGILAGVAGIKIVVAVGRGHTNVVFLLLFAIVAFAALLRLYRRERTAHGDQALQNLKVLLAARRSQIHRVRAGSDSDDALLVSAVYGLSVLPTETFPYLKGLFPKKSQSSGSCSSSCGGGCGGGGCGGGCGGCGS